MWSVHNKNKNGGWLKRKYANKARTRNHCHFLVFVLFLSLICSHLIVLSLFPLSLSSPVRFLSFSLFLSVCLLCVYLCACVCLCYSLCVDAILSHSPETVRVWCIWISFWFAALESFSKNQMDVIKSRSFQFNCTGFNLF